MSLIVSLHNKILCIPEIEETHHIIHQAKTVGMSTGTYGITWNDKKIYAKSSPKNKGSIIIEKSKKIEEKILSLNAGSHQWYYCPIKNCVLIADTDSEGLTSYNCLTKTKQLIKYKEQKNLHINSIWQHNNYYWVVEHRKGPSVIVKLENDLQTIAEEHQLGVRCHNVFIRNDKELLTLSSGEDQIVVKNLLNGKIKKYNFFTDFWLRGLAYDGNYFYIGGSPKNKVREKRNSKNGKIFVFNNDFDNVDYIDIPYEGQIMEIRLNRNDLAHNGLNCPINFPTK